jgi:hypothetical protein
MLSSSSPDHRPCARVLVTIAVQLQPFFALALAVLLLPSLPQQLTMFFALQVSTREPVTRHATLHPHRPAVLSLQLISSIVARARARLVAVNTHLSKVVFVFEKFLIILSHCSCLLLRYNAHLPAVTASRALVHPVFGRRRSYLCFVTHPPTSPELQCRRGRTVILLSPVGDCRLPHAD